MLLNGRNICDFSLHLHLLILHLTVFQLFRLDGMIVELGMIQQHFHDLRCLLYGNVLLVVLAETLRWWSHDDRCWILCARDDRLE